MEWFLGKNHSIHTYIILERFGVSMLWMLIITYLYAMDPILLPPYMDPMYNYGPIAYLCYDPISLSILCNLSILKIVKSCYMYFLSSDAGVVSIIILQYTHNYSKTP